MTMDMSRYLGLFVTEASEHLEALGRDLVQLEKEGGASAVDSMFRHAHSVKGMASSMGFEPIATLAHRVEDLVDAVRQDASRLDRELVDLLLSATDTHAGAGALGGGEQAARGGRRAADPAGRARVRPHRPGAGAHPGDAGHRAAHAGSSAARRAGSAASAPATATPAARGHSPVPLTAPSLRGLRARRCGLAPSGAAGRAGALRPRARARRRAGR